MKVMFKKFFMIALFVGLTGCTRCDNGANTSVPADAMTPVPAETMAPAPVEGEQMMNSVTPEGAVVEPTVTVTPGDTSLTPGTSP